MRSSGGFCVVVLSLLISVGCSSPSEKPPEPKSKSAAASNSWPVAGTTWQECEGGICGTWTWQTSTDGTASWPNGAKAALHVQQVSGDTIVIERRDGEGVSKGLSGIYTGKREGMKLTGGVVFTVPDQPSSGTAWEGTISPSR